ncbi:MAG: zf-HC2 domain-containing protein [Ignavibacteriae bacterium]|nr:zf-HC2 domain-containing protein [Ignavibacteriota bacterium]
MLKHTQHHKGISCEEAIKRVYDFIDNHLKAKARAELEHHLETCRHCFDRVEFEKLLKARLRHLKVDTESKALRKKIDELIEQF